MNNMQRIPSGEHHSFSKYIFIYYLSCRGEQEKCLSGMSLAEDYVPVNKDSVFRARKRGALGSVPILGWQASQA